MEAQAGRAERRSRFATRSGGRAAAASVTLAQLASLCVGTAALRIDFVEPPPARHSSNFHFLSLALLSLNRRFRFSTIIVFRRSLINFFSRLLFVTRRKILGRSRQSCVVPFKIKVWCDFFLFLPRLSHFLPSSVAASCLKMCFITCKSWIKTIKQK